MSRNKRNVFSFTYSQGKLAFKLSTIYRFCVRFFARWKCNTIGMYNSKYLILSLVKSLPMDAGFSFNYSNSCTWVTSHKDSELEDLQHCDKARIQSPACVLKTASYLHLQSVFSNICLPVYCFHNRLSMNT